MPAQDRLARLSDALAALLPADGGFMGNATLFGSLKSAMRAEGLRVTEADYEAARDFLVTAHRAVKGRGRGGSLARVLTRGKVALVPGELQLEPTPRPHSVTAPKRGTRPQPKPRIAVAPGDPQVLSYRHGDKRKNNPEVGLVNEIITPQEPPTAWAYDPHLDPDLRFDTARATAEDLIDGALATDDPAMLAALEELKRMGSPHLQWTGKAERTSFEVDTVSLHVHERVDPMCILAAVSKGAGRDKGKGNKSVLARVFGDALAGAPRLDASADRSRRDVGRTCREVPLQGRGLSACFRAATPAVCQHVGHPGVRS